jgi:mRNA interferase MazF
MSTAADLAPGDVVLVPFPFTDQSGSKKRLAVVVSGAAYQAGRRDLIIMALTSQVRLPLGFGEALVQEWQAAGLVKPTVMKPVLTTIAKSLVVRRMGCLAPEDAAALRTLLGQVLG